MEYDYKNVKAPCPNISCGSKKNDCCGITKVVLAAVLGDDSDTSPVRPENGAYCNKIVEYEANGAVYFYSSDGIYTKLGNKSKSEETASVEYVDQQTRYAVQTSEDYTDNQLRAQYIELADYADNKAAGALQDAKDYADGKDSDNLALAEAYTDGAVASAVGDLKDYADGAAADALQAAKDYTDSAASSVVTRSYVDTGDGNTLDAAKQYTDDEITIVSTAVQGLSNSLATVATSGSYDDLSNKPTIPEFILVDSTNDPGEGSPLAANTFIGVYN